MADFTTDADGVIDLDAHRAARIERAGGAKKVRLGGEIIELRAELPIDVVEQFSGLTADNLASIFDLMAATEEDAEKLRKARPTIEDVDALVELWGVSLGESQASASSSESADELGL